MWQLYSVYDQVAGTYSNPVTARNDAVAARLFVHSVSTEGESLVKSHPDDYSLVRIGSFDEVDGLVSACATPELVMTGRVAVRSTEPFPGE